VVTSSPIPAPAAGVSGNAAADLLTALGSVPDPRSGVARPHPAGYVLVVLVAAFSRAGFASLTGAAQGTARVVHGGRATFSATP
jgi:hypothetical protein